MSPAQAREQARHILSERRFRGTSLPRPFHGFLSWLARHLNFLARGWDWLAGRIGGPHVLWGLVGAIVLVAAVVLRCAWPGVAPRSRSAASGVRAAGKSEDPADLERLADEAERQGDLEVALRLRFRAGLLRLGRAQALPLRPSLRTREARRVLRNARFDRLARDFDEVVYGRRVPSAGDVVAARTEWPLVLAEARR